MNTNVFLISDASYNNLSEEAGLGVIDMHTNRSYQFGLQNIKSINDAKMHALIRSVKIAMKLNYRNVVFFSSVHSPKIFLYIIYVILVHCVEKLNCPIKTNPVTIID